ncbi:hypothetical protein [Pedococcus sp. 5OH_020]|uniref:hypothetical protein n=1 Tax=Pedococcus sp. 5OH_020 TaxID=2989814 RepID=UPI0022E9D20A|nr:hypothetical protein [Pedococcus sp. 5OH_020]
MTRPPTRAAAILAIALTVAGCSTGTISAGTSTTPSGSPTSAPSSTSPAVTVIRVSIKPRSTDDLGGVSVP